MCSQVATEHLGRLFVESHHIQRRVVVPAFEQRPGYRTDVAATYLHLDSIRGLT